MYHKRNSVSFARTIFDIFSAGKIANRVVSRLMGLNRLIALETAFEQAWDAQWLNLCADFIF
jgi:hypothetical protein